MLRSNFLSCFATTLRLTAGVVLMAQAVTALADDWPRFRGPDGAGKSPDPVPVRWSDDNNVSWRLELPGPGASSPIVNNDCVFLTCYSGYGVDASSNASPQDLKRHLLCVDEKSGELLWNSEMSAEAEQRRYGGFVALHGYASSTPAADDEAIYVYYGASGAAAYDYDGQRLWRTSCGTGTHSFGTANSPVLHQELVIVNASVECGALIGLQKATGKEIWRRPGMDASWNTPVLVAVPNGQPELVVNVKGFVLGIDPKSGEELWRCRGIPDYICPSIIAGDGVIYAIGGRRNTAIAVRAGGRGDVTETHKLWEVNKGSNVSSPVLHDGHLYWASDGRGIAFCVDAENGEVVYQERIDPKPGRIYASPVVADDKLYYVSRDRGTFVFAAAPTFELLANNVLAGDASVFNGSPAVSDGRLFLRSDRYLYCIQD